jgi:hypothetical protein
VPGRRTSWPRSRSTAPRPCLLRLRREDGPARTWRWWWSCRFQFGLVSAVAGWSIVNWRACSSNTLEFGCLASFCYDDDDDGDGMATLLIPALARVLDHGDSEITLRCKMKILMAMSTAGTFPSNSLPPPSS